MAHPAYFNKAGERVPSVTTIIGKNLGWDKDPLMFWAWREGRDGRDFRQTRDKAATQGHYAHEMIDEYIHGREWKCPTEGVNRFDVDMAAMAFAAFVRWAKGSDFFPIATEISMVSEAHQFGGTPDCPAMVNNELSMFDWKTGNGVYEDHLIQVRAYKELWNENHPSQLITGGHHLVRLGKEVGNFTHHWIPDAALDGAWRVFLKLRAIHDERPNLKALSR